ncbi:uncharacterized protein RCC_12204 [Ramularia collo-cygni]|uniref:Uncharacterized protein n=1 Tax=Ramularia collo-cygni TaxID=112498 RepID=A0A2D3V1E0_9PEZI|nr:uncharacterized protein RCC_12204 [Ramularia collo-cygni]CZT15319.1 uncharacterized protein RCC_12204 [Ramularia collo-cygni]
MDGFGDIITSIDTDLTTSKDGTSAINGRTFTSDNRTPVSTEENFTGDKDAAKATRVCANRSTQVMESTKDIPSPLHYEERPQNENEPPAPSFVTIEDEEKLRCTQGNGRRRDAALVILTKLLPLIKVKPAHCPLLYSYYESVAAYVNCIDEFINTRGRTWFYPPKLYYLSTVNPRVKVDVYSRIVDEKREAALSVITLEGEVDAKMLDYLRLLGRLRKAELEARLQWEDMEKSCDRFVRKQGCGNWYVRTRAQEKEYVNALFAKWGVDGSKWLEKQWQGKDMRMRRFWARVGIEVLCGDGKRKGY